jgi:hypothetical protein
MIPPVALGAQPSPVPPMPYREMVEPIAKFPDSAVKVALLIAAVFDQRPAKIV